jgi:hypothetical protein
MQHIGRIDHGHIDPGNIPQQNGFRVAPLEHQVTEGLNVVLAAEAQRVFAPADFVETGGNIRVAAQLTGDFGQIETDVSCLEGIEGNPYLVFATAERPHSRNSRHALEAGDDHIVDKVFVAIDRARIALLRIDGPPRDDLVEIIPTETYNRLVRVHRVTRHLVQAVHHLDQGPVHVGADLELQIDVTAAVGCRLHFQKSGNAAQHVLLRLDDLRLDLVRRRCPPRRSYGYFRPRNFRRHLDGQAHQADHAENGQQDTSHDNGDRVRQ